MSVVLMVNLPVFVACWSFKFLYPRKTRYTDASQTPVDLYLNHLAFNEFSFFLDSDPNTPPERLCESFCLGHGQRKHFARGDHRKWNVGA